MKKAPYGESLVKKKGRAGKRFDSACRQIEPKNRLKPAEANLGSEEADSFDDFSKG